MVDGETNTPTSITETQNNASETRPSLAERLMNVDSSNTPAGNVVTAKAADRSGSTWRPQIARVPDGLDKALMEVRRFIWLRYLLYLVSAVGAFVLAAAGSTIFISEMLGHRNWEKLALSGVLALISLVILGIVQYRPERGIRSAPFRSAQLEAARLTLNHSIELWEEFLTHRESMNQLSPMDVAAAVASLTAAARAFGDLDSRPPAQPKTREPSKSQLPTAVSPDPQRYS